MLRQLIAQVQDLLHLYGSPPPLQPPSSPFNLLQFHQPPPPSDENHRRWCFPNIDDTSSEDYHSLMMAAGKSGNCKMLEPFKPPPSKKSRKERNRGKLPGNTPTPEVMEQEIWKEFPEDLFEAVIARLPIATFFRFRSVCRKWNSLLESQSFSQHCVEIPPSNPWFFTITHENMNVGAMYDPSTRKWHHPTISFLPAKMIALPVASVGGLVCFLDIGHRNFYVCNPLTQSFKELPARSVKVWSRVAVGMTLNGNSTSGGYKILWVGCDGEYEVYDSVKNSWSRPGSMPSNIKLPLSLNFRSQAISIDNTLYFMQSDPEGIVSYNMVTGVWKQFIIPAPIHLSDQTLAECDGRIMLVGLLTKKCRHLCLHMGAAEDDALVEGGGQNAKHMGVAEGSRMYSPMGKKATVDSLWHRVSPVPDCHCLISISLLSVSSSNDKKPSEFRTAPPQTPIPVLSS
ncbi:hypothetical protein V6N13_115556 [Hibiscus sabdariffa]